MKIIPQITQKFAQISSTIWINVAGFLLLLLTGFGLFLIPLNAFQGLNFQRIKRKLRPR